MNRANDMVSDNNQAKDMEIAYLEQKITELEKRIAQLRFSRRVLLNLLEKVIMEKKTPESKIIKFNPLSRQK